MKDGAMNSKLSPEARAAELAQLEAMPDDAIDTRDIPEAPADSWLDARRSDLYRPVKQAITIRLDADVLAWFKSNADGGGYQTEINRVLREHVTAAHKRGA